MQREQAVNGLVCRLSHGRPTGIAKLLRSVEERLGGPAALAAAVGNLVAEVCANGTPRQRSRVVLALLAMMTRAYSSRPQARAAKTQQPAEDEL